MVVDYSLGGMIPEIKEKMKTEHFILSEAILDIRFEKKLTFDEAAEILDIPRETYIKFEYGDNDIDINEYRDVLQKLQEYNSNEAITSNGGDIEDKPKLAIDEEAMKVFSNYITKIPYRIKRPSLATEITDIFTDLVPEPNKKQHSYESSFNSQEVEKTFSFVEDDGLRSLNDVKISKDREGTAA